MTTNMIQIRNKSVYSKLEIKGRNWHNFTYCQGEWIKKKQTKTVKIPAAVAAETTTLLLDQLSFVAMVALTSPGRPQVQL